jgi:hypothetical protein
VIDIAVWMTIDDPGEDIGQLAERRAIHGLIVNFPPGNDGRSVARNNQPRPVTEFNKWVKC